MDIKEFKDLLGTELTGLKEDMEGKTTKEVNEAIANIETKMTDKVEQEKVLKSEQLQEAAPGSNPAIEVKHDLLKNQLDTELVYTNSDGVKYRLVPVGSTIVQASMDKIADRVIGSGSISFR